MHIPLHPHGEERREEEAIARGATYKRHNDPIHWHSRKEPSRHRERKKEKPTDSLNDRMG